MAGQTLEPWREGPTAGIGQRGKLVVVGPDGLKVADCKSALVGPLRYARPLAEDTANAQRIVACVNALAGIADPETTIPSLIQVLRDAVAELGGIHSVRVPASIHAVLAQVPKENP